MRIAFALMSVRKGEETLDVSFSLCGSASFFDVSSPFGRGEEGGAGGRHSILKSPGSVKGGVAGS